jgi:hypothetical protein
MYAIVIYSLGTNEPFKLLGYSLSVAPLMQVKHKIANDAFGVSTTITTPVLKAAAEETTDKGSDGGDGTSSVVSIDDNDGKSK